MADGVETSTTEGGSEVTFVNGKAVEQKEGNSLPSTGDAQHDSERAAAVKAVREAIGKAAKEAKESAPKVAKQSGFRPEGVTTDEDEGLMKAPAKAAKPEPEEDEEVDLDKASVKQLFKHREKLAGAKRDAVTKHQQEMAQLQQERQQFEQEKLRIQQERLQIQRQAQRLAKLKSDPAQAVMEAGWDPEEFIVNLAQEGTEAGKQARAHRQMQQELAEIRQWKQQQAEQYQQALQAQEHHQQVQFRQSVEQEFLTAAFDEKTRPHTASFYKGRERALIAEGDLIAADYREMTGREASLSEIADYVEEQLAERYKTWYETSRKLGLTKDEAHEVAASETGGAPSAGKRGKTLSGSISSERRSLGSALKDLDGDERLEAAREAVRQAIR
jgi:hypothetical protein